MLKGRCPEDHTLQRFMAGFMADSDALPIELHLQSCPSCVARMEEVSIDDALLVEVKRCGRDALPQTEPLTVVELIQRLRVAPSATEGMTTASWPPPGDSPQGGAETPFDSGHSSTDAPLPPRLGRYRLLHLLGAGGMGTVYLAEDPDLGRPVALKIPRLVSSPEGQTAARQRFLREARAAASVRHPHVCPIYDVGEQDGIPFVVMARIDGCSLAERLKRDGRITDYREAAALAVQLAEGLAAIHEKGIIHRDLKPGNILLDKDGSAFVTDFGLARWQNDGEHLTATGAFLGTPAYVAPEQVSRAPDFGPVTPRTDLYSLGVVIYQMLTGRLPFAAADGLQSLYQIVHETPPPPSESRPDVDPALESIVLKAMARRPEDRFADARELAASLRGWLNGKGTVEQVPAEPPPISLATSQIEFSARPSRRRRRWSWRIGGGAAVGTILLGLFALVQSNRAPKDDGTSVYPDSAERLQSDANPLPVADNANRISNSLDVQVWKQGKPPGRGLAQADVLPLAPGDRIRVEAEVDHPAYLYVVWIDSKGEAQPIYPWNPPGQWKLPEKEDRITRLSLPKETDIGWGIKADDPRGMETLLLLVRATPWPRDQDLEKLFAGLPRAAEQNAKSAVWFKDWTVVHDEDLRGPNFFDKARLDDPVLETQRLLRERLKDLCDYSRAVSFANAGK